MQPREGRGCLQSGGWLYGRHNRDRSPLTSAGPEALRGGARRLWPLRSGPRRPTCSGHLQQLTEVTSASYTLSSSKVFPTALRWKLHASHKIKSNLAGSLFLYREQWSEKECCVMHCLDGEERSCPGGLACPRTVCARVSACMCIYTCVGILCMCVCVSLYWCVQGHMHMCIVYMCPCVCVYMHVCVDVCACCIVLHMHVHGCVYAYMHSFQHMCTHMCAHMHVSIYGCAQACVHVPVYVCTRVCIYTWMSLCVQVCIYITHMHTGVNT